MKLPVIWQEVSRLLLLRALLRLVCGIWGNSVPWADLIWSRSPLLSVNALSHCSHLCGFTPVCFLKWDVKWLFHENALLQLSTVHLNGFTLSWMTKCWPRFISLVNDLPHTLHTYGFTPAWIFKWSVSWVLFRNIASHRSHLNLFSFSCTVFRWMYRLECLPNDFPQSWHVHFFSSLWPSIWHTKRRFWSNFFPHWAQSNTSELSARQTRQ